MLAANVAAAGPDRLPPVDMISPFTCFKDKTNVLFFSTLCSKFNEYDANDYTHH